MPKGEILFDGLISEESESGLIIEPYIAGTNFKVSEILSMQERYEDQVIVEKLGITYDQIYACQDCDEEMSSGHIESGFIRAQDEQGNFHFTMLSVVTDNDIIVSHGKHSFSYIADIKKFKDIIKRAYLLNNTEVMVTLA